MIIQVGLFWKCSITNIAFIVLLLFMNCLNVHLRAKLESQMLHLKDVFSSWTDSTWVFKLTFWVVRITNIAFEFLFFMNWASQFMHLKGFLFSCTDFMCFTQISLTNSCHRHHIWMPFFPHELIHHVISDQTL